MRGDAQQKWLASNFWPTICRSVWMFRMHCDALQKCKKYNSFYFTQFKLLIWREARPPVDGASQLDSFERLHELIPMDFYIHFKLFLRIRHMGDGKILYDVKRPPCQWVTWYVPTDCAIKLWSVTDVRAENVNKARFRLWCRLKSKR